MGIASLFVCGEVQTMELSKLLLLLLLLFLLLGTIFNFDFFRNRDCFIKEHL